MLDWFMYISYQKNNMFFIIVWRLWKFWHQLNCTFFVPIIYLSTPFLWKNKRLYNSYIAYIFSNCNVFENRCIYNLHMFHAVKLRVIEKVVLVITSTIRYTKLCKCIEHYTTGIDYNQDLYIYISYHTSEQ